jgi:hypothetical protein
VRPHVGPMSAYPEVRTLSHSISSYIEGTLFANSYRWFHIHVLAKIFPVHPSGILNEYGSNFEIPKCRRSNIYWSTEDSIFTRWVTLIRRPTGLATSALEWASRTILEHIGAEGRGKPWYSLQLDRCNGNVFQYRDPGYVPESLSP